MDEIRTIWIAVAGAQSAVSGRQYGAMAPTYGEGKGGGGGGGGEGGGKEPQDADEDTPFTPTFPVPADMELVSQGLERRLLESWRARGAQRCNLRRSARVQGIVRLTTCLACRRRCRACRCQPSSQRVHRIIGQMARRARADTQLEILVKVSIRPSRTEPLSRFCARATKWSGRSVLAPRSDLPRDVCTH